MKRKIFSNLGRKDLQTILQIDSNWKIVIDDLRKWKKKMFSKRNKTMEKSIN